MAQQHHISIDMSKFYGFYKNLNINPDEILKTVAWQEHSHCMGNKTAPVPEFYTCGFYTPENTAHWHAKESQMTFDISKIFDEFNLINHTATMIKLDPGCSLPWHRDRFHMLKEKTPNWNEIKHLPMRYCIFMQDWKLGQFVQIEELVVSNWKAGDCWYFCHDTWHLATNAGLESFVTMQISGFRPVDQ